MITFKIAERDQGVPFRYRPEIDGLRALAVIAVVGFHGKLGLPGGFVGVDVFFVISGYLITSLIIRDLNLGKFSILAFWSRRVLRILPAVNVTVIATLIFAWFILLPIDFKKLGMSAISQALMAANIYFWHDDSANGGYFGPTSEDRPLLHTWSLAVEEQFYIFFPLLLILLFRFESIKNLRVLRLLFTAGVVAGLSVAAFGMTRSPGATFYLLPTRAWELLCGALVATLPVSALPVQAATREVLSWVGLLGIIVPFFAYSSDTKFPGFAAVPPCLGTAIFIWCNIRVNSACRLTSPARILTLRPVVFVGLISYSLYLWHWPVLIFGNYWKLVEHTSLFHRLGLVVLAFFPAIVSWKFVELPFRNGKVIQSPAGIITFAAICLMSSLAFGYSIYFNDGFPSRMPPLVMRNQGTSEDRPGYRFLDSSVEDVRAGLIGRLGNEADPSSPRILLWGDSHAGHAAPALDAFCREAGVIGVSITRSSTPPLIDAAFDTPNGLNEKAPEFSAAVISKAAELGVTDIILAAYWSKYQINDAALLESSLVSTIKILNNSGFKVWVLLDIPDSDVNVSRMLSRVALFKESSPPYVRMVEDHRKSNSLLLDIASRGLPATFIDPAPALLDESHRYYNPDLNGVSIYHDNDHLTVSGSLAVLLPVFRDAFSDRFPTGAESTGIPGSVGGN
ncbi:MAG: acyltransferase [Verrucomicrobiales bacterium]|jgi:peptidoglycan/LPS O-acetylase OafA/YrhL|nr:acyltransferase [Verrucomicrobiales bacterium]